MQDVHACVLLDRQHEPLACLHINGCESFNRQSRHGPYVNVSSYLTNAAMTDQPVPRPSQLWKHLSPERKTQAAEAFWRDENAAMEQAEALATIAQRLKFRPKSAFALPVEKKVKYLVGMPAVSELVAARLLVAYHLEHQRPMMRSFLDALGIAHEEGLIADEEMKALSPDALKAAANTLAASYPKEDVSLYLSTLMWQDPETWGPLAESL